MPHPPPLATPDAHMKKIQKIQLNFLNKPWREVLHLGTRHLFPKHHCEPGEKVRGFYFIAKGRVRLTYLGESGKEKCALYMGKDCIFNEIPVLGGSGPLCASFFCLEEVEAWSFKAELLSNNSFIIQYPELIANLLHSMAQKAGIFFSQSSEKAFSTSKHQLCTVLLELHANTQLCLSQSDVASLLGVHLTTVARLIRSLRDQKIIGRFTKTSFEVLDIERLRLLAKDSGD